MKESFVLLPLVKSFSKCSGSKFGRTTWSSVRSSQSPDVGGGGGGGRADEGDAEAGDICRVQDMLARCRSPLLVEFGSIPYQSINPFEYRLGQHRVVIFGTEDECEASLIIGIVEGPSMKDSRRIFWSFVLVQKHEEFGKCCR